MTISFRPEYKTGYIMPKRPNCSHLTVTELRNLLSRRGLDTQGNKNELMARLYRDDGEARPSAPANTDNLYDISLGDLQISLRTMNISVATYSANRTLPHPFELLSPPPLFEHADPAHWKPLLVRMISELPQNVAQRLEGNGAYQKKRIADAFWTIWRRADGMPGAVNKVLHEYYFFTDNGSVHVCFAAWGSDTRYGARFLTQRQHPTAQEVAVECKKLPILFCKPFGHSYEGGFRAIYLECWRALSVSYTSRIPETVGQTLKANPSKLGALIALLETHIKRCYCDPQWQENVAQARILSNSIAGKALLEAGPPILAVSSAKYDDRNV